tara:strand:+ start:479 stop:682 length:204 start_codon:yes stop_codon:yes gene_type:complete
MALDAISISAIIISVITALGAFVKTTHLQKCKSCCIESDCRDKKNKSEPITPIDSEPAVIPLGDISV